MSTTSATTNYAALFNELNTDKTTITLAEQMGYDLNTVKDWLKEDPTNEYTKELLTSRYTSCPFQSTALDAITGTSSPESNRCM